MLETSKHFSWFCYLTDVIEFLRNVWLSQGKILKLDRRTDTQD